MDYALRDPVIYHFTKESKMGSIIHLTQREHLQNPVYTSTYMYVCVGVCRAFLALPFTMYIHPIPDHQFQLPASREPSSTEGKKRDHVDPVHR